VPAGRRPGAYWAARADRFDEGVASYHDQFLAAAAIDPTANVLDIGCGSGQTTRDAARRAKAGSALGVDLSSRMIELARGLAEKEGVANATFRQADAQVHPFPDQCFDVVISRHGTSPCQRCADASASRHGPVCRARAAWHQLTILRRASKIAFEHEEQRNTERQTIKNTRHYYPAG
jgi:SAM-dependent methyltransferase